MKKYGFILLRDADDRGLPSDTTIHFDMMSYSTTSLCGMWNQQWDFERLSPQ